jgi:tetratricopeptide (TPR) repeat protein
LEVSWQRSWHDAAVQPGDEADEAHDSQPGTGTHREGATTHGSLTIAMGFAAYRQCRWADKVMDVNSLLLHWEAELRHRVGRDYRLEAALGVSWCLSSMGRHSEALEKLDAFAPKRPSPELLALWLNSRAYELTMLGRAEEALIHLDDAATVAGQETAAGQCLTGCIMGTRGIALLHLGRLREAEDLLLGALDRGRAAAAAEGVGDGPVHQQERFLAGERWFWLSEISERQGRTDEARRRLDLAALAKGPYAERAQARLAE